MAAMTSAQQMPRSNHLLAALPAASYERIAAHLECMSMPLGETLYESGLAPHQAYFPTTAIISLHQVMEDGASSEFASVGNEGMIGLPLVMGGHTPPGLATVCAGGAGYRLKGQVLADAFEHDGAVRRLLLRYIQARLSQVAQTAACNRHHTMEQHMCRWLLEMLDRLPSRELVMTQELIAGILGVRREGITETAGALQRDGLISYRRGHITVVNREGLESRACECYQVVKDEFRRVLGPYATVSAHPPREI